MFYLLFYLLHILSLPAICILIYDICIFVFSSSVSGAPCTCRVQILGIFHLCSLTPTHPSPDWFQSTCKRMTAWMIKQGLIDTFPFSCNEFLISVPALRQAQGFAACLLHDEPSQKHPFCVGCGWVNPSTADHEKYVKIDEKWWKCIKTTTFQPIPTSCRMLTIAAVPSQLIQRQWVGDIPNLLVRRCRFGGVVGNHPWDIPLWKTPEVLESNFRFSHFSQIVHGFFTRSPKTWQSSKAEVGTSGRTKVWNLSGPLPINCLKKLTNLHPENLPKHSFHWNLEIPGRFP